jgi:hypothetical protein
MPAVPRWISRINEITRSLRELPHPFVDRATVEKLLGIGRRRAQQILAPCVSHRVGANGLADRDALLQHLQTLAAGDAGDHERDRRRRVAGVLEELRRERVAAPQVLVEAPLRVLTQQLINLPAGVALAPGRITVEFSRPREALEKLLALAMAIGNDFPGFEQMVRAGDRVSASAGLQRV